VGITFNQRFALKNAANARKALQKERNRKLRRPDHPIDAHRSFS
jgi:hypothetical protein